MSKAIDKQYFGKAGHLYVMSEFLLKGWNVATPEVDTGDDVFVVQDRKEPAQVARVQVKTATAIITKKGYKAQFSLRLDQLKRTTITPKLVYVFVCRLQDKWLPLCIVEQSFLRDIYKQQNTQAKSNAINLTIFYEEERLICYGQDFSAHQNNFKAIFLA